MLAAAVLCYIQFLVSLDKWMDDGHLAITRLIMFLDTVSVLKSLFALQAVSNFMIKCFLPLIQIILSFFFWFFNQCIRSNRRAS